MDKTKLGQFAAMMRGAVKQVPPVAGKKPENGIKPAGGAAPSASANPDDDLLF
jgi:hypothetical protein